MRRRVRASSLFHLAAASWETILRRSVMMANGTCSPAEYRRMVDEKVKASQEAGVALMTGRDAVAPYLKAARANAKRLRKR